MAEPLGTPAWPGLERWLSCLRQYQQLAAARGAESSPDAVGTRFHGCFADNSVRRGSAE